MAPVSRTSHSSVICSVPAFTRQSATALIDEALCPVGGPNMPSPPLCVPVVRMRWDES